MPGGKGSVPALCRDCLTRFESAAQHPRCPNCRSPRVLAHGELNALSIAHIDCDAFYASVEKRDDPSLADKPVIIGGGKRGVVATACYVARIRGVHSAMPMFKALKLCPDAMVIKPRMQVYAAVSREIRNMMLAVTPLVEPLSLDEAFLDLSGTERLHGARPVAVLADLARRVQREVGVSVSVGLSHCKFLAKIASDLEKPRGFSVIGKAEALDFLADKPVGLIWGVGKALQGSLEREGVQKIADLRRLDEATLMARHGEMGRRLHRRSHGIDHRKVNPNSEMKSISNEMTFNVDIDDADLLEGHLWRLAVKVADRCKAKGAAGRIVTLKLKTAKHAILTRRHSLDSPTQLADAIYREGRALMDRAGDKGPYRLIGIGLSDLSATTDDVAVESAGDLFDPTAGARATAERAMDDLRRKFGEDAVIKGRALK